MASAVVLGSAGTALAVSDGNYDYNKQHCSAYAANSDSADYAEPGCRTLSANVWTGSNGEYSPDNEVGSAGIQQTPDGEMPHEPNYTEPQDGAAEHAPEGVHAYFGADDNLDYGEHDSSELVDNGPSDGGGIQANVDPATVALWLAALSAGDTGYLLAHPIPLASAGIGAGADGIMFSVQTDRQVAWAGTGEGDRDVADYEGKEWDPDTCSGPHDTAEDCGGNDIAYWEAKEGDTYAEPGIQVYEAPDPQGSPLDPADEIGVESPVPVYPLPAAYVGTCGVILGGGGVQAPESPATNSAGQLAVKTGCE